MNIRYFAAGNADISAVLAPMNYPESCPSLMTLIAVIFMKDWVRLHRIFRRTGSSQPKKH
jgi:hypothetical protein